jgi:hypothetical protein
MIAAAESGTFRKACSCGAVHDRESWRRLPLVGVWRVPQVGAVLSMRNCSCGSTIAVDQAAEQESA